MIESLISEYVLCAEAKRRVDYSDRKSVRRSNAAADRMRVIVDEPGACGQPSECVPACQRDSVPGACGQPSECVPA